MADVRTRAIALTDSLLPGDVLLVENNNEPVEQWLACEEEDLALVQSRLTAHDDLQDHPFEQDYSALIGQCAVCARMEEAILEQEAADDSD